jgi:hypothetical protein
MNKNNTLINKNFKTWLIDNKPTKIYSAEFKALIFRIIRANVVYTYGLIIKINITSGQRQID